MVIGEHRSYTMFSLLLLDCRQGHRKRSKERPTVLNSVPPPWNRRVAPAIAIKENDMSIAPLFQDLIARELPLVSIFLDPNNPRFVGPNWQRVEDDKIDSEPVQEGARMVLIRDYGVEKLRMNMEVNGYLPIDRVIVRKFKDDKFVVLEGNRRICAAKMLGPIGMDGTEVSEEVLTSANNIPCLEYVGAEADAAWIFQGLRHITGISEWSAYNKAKLLVEQMEQEELNLTQAGKRFGLSAFGAGQWVRGYYAFKQAREESDYIREVDEQAYPYFQELFSRSSAPVREWLGWEEEDYKFKNPLNFNEFVGWLYPRPTEEAGSDVLGKFENRKLSRRDDIRLVSFLLKESDKYFQQFRNGQDLEPTYAMAQAELFQQRLEEETDRVGAVFNAISACTKALDDIPHKVFKDKALKDELDGRIAVLEKAIATVK
jgi:hypothetical protein